MDKEFEESMIQQHRMQFENTNDPFKFKIHVANLDKDITEQELLGYFSRFGGITDIKIIRKINGDQGYNYSFITYDSVESAKRALKESIGWSVKIAMRNTNTTSS